MAAQREPASPQETQRTGRIDRQLWVLARTITRMMAADTQEVEGLNSIIKRCLEMAPGMGLELLSSWALLRKTVDRG
eukprot:4749462-Pyramimonas_sp.AAC.1